jgi:hypothetical protein
MTAVETYLRLGLSVVEWKNIVEESHLLGGEVDIERLRVAVEVPPEISTIHQW